MTTFAAADDPWVLDRRLAAERDEHLAMLAAAPPDRRRSLDEARVAAYQAASRHIAAADDLKRAEARVASFGPLTGLRRSSREQRAHAEDWLSRAHDSLDRTTSQRRTAESRVVALEAGEERRLWFGVEHSWRVERIKAIDAELARHWSVATLAAVRQDDPLAFGIERLRGARTSHAAQLASLEQGLPPDRAGALKRAEQEHGGTEYALRQARFAAKDQRQSLDVASERHWGRRDKQAMATALQGVKRADFAVVAALKAEEAARRRLDEELAAQQRRAQAVAAHAPQRVELTQALAELDAALDDTRAARVLAMTGEHLAHAHLVAVLGEPPADPAGQAVWRGLACRVESYRDRHPETLGHESDGGVMAAIGPRPVERWMTAPEWDALAGRLARGHALVAVAGEIASPGEDTLPGDPSSWIELMDQASLVLEASRQTVNRGLSRDHGLDLGL